MDIDAIALKKLDLTESQSAPSDSIAANAIAVEELLPEAFSEGKVNFEVLKQLLGARVDDSGEKYGLSWHGKSHARQLALTASLGTLRPVREESVDWDTTRNVMIEGDNLEALRLLQKSFAGRVKAIYIDPPYNTGKDRIYPDTFTDSIKNYLELTAQLDGGRRISSNPETGGRFHSAWLSMIYPRLKLSRSLLTDDGVIFISVDEREFQNLRLVCNDLFGEECFVGTLVVLSNPKGRSQDKYFATNHEYVVVYSKSVRPKGSFSIAKDEDQIEAEYPEEDEIGKYRLLELRNTHREFGRHNRPNLFYPLFVDEEGKVSLESQEDSTRVRPIWSDGYEGCWTWDKEKAAADIDLLLAKRVDGDWKIYRKSYAEGADRMLKTILVDRRFFTERGQKEFNELFGTRDRIFQAPKSPYLIAQLLQTCTGNSDIIVDFFAGSGTTAQAAWMLNSADMSNRRVILVQLPEPLDPEDPDQRAAADFCASIGKPLTIAELTKERLRRAAMKIARDNPETIGDMGFRVFKLDSSNIRPWHPQPTDVRQLILDSTDHIIAERSDQDLLFELLLKLGYDLCTPMSDREITGKTVHAIEQGSLIACLARSIARDEAEALAEGIAEWRAELAPPGETMCVFRDSAFHDDVAKTNLTTILAQRGLTNVRSI